eukprot:TRINITY_DN5115_c0_g1_i1.p1 TRINITY_DN5115_c0_g1~~TRINITY_DN5115_c0_g1_i1.p1  ORF type:complete len:250 (-),score=16.44 TRINITY_DN5115_c0_g1_i1:4-753(-)
MLPTTSSTRTAHSYFPSVRGVVPEYLRRIILYSQMDFEYCFWMMFYLCVNPARVYRTTSWHKQTKNQWARDDPAFVAIMILFMGVAALAFSITFHRTGFFQIWKLIFWAIFIDFLLVGAFVATIGWWLSNRYLRTQAIHSVEQRVEWLYAFDIHCNSFFPLFLILYVIQFFLSPLLLRPGIFATISSNTLYFAALAYYHHITFLGYSALPFLQNTVVFLYPVGMLFVLYLFSIIFNFNATSFVLIIYFG